MARRDGVASLADSLDIVMAYIVMARRDGVASLGGSLEVASRSELNRRWPDTDGPTN